MQPQSSPEMHLERFPHPQQSQSHPILLGNAEGTQPRAGNNQGTSTTSLNSEHYNLYASPIK